MTPLKNPDLGVPVESQPHSLPAEQGFDAPMAPAIPGPDDELHDYHAAKLALAGQLRLLRESLKHRGDERGSRRCEELLVKLAEDRFTLAVLGQFKRGKSSLLNALVGRELLPVGVLPLTSAITALRFGPRERLLIERRSGATDRTFTTEEPLDRLADFVTERGNPGNRLRIRAAYLESPSSFLRRGVEFVDTPGVGSAIEANAATTRDFLPHCDAALFVTSAEAPLSEVELRLLSEIRQHLRKIFFVVNKSDLLDFAERCQILGHTTRVLREKAGIDDAKIFAVSARFGLDGSRNQDAELTRRSGLPDLRAALAEFLAGEKNQTFLAVIIEKALRLLDSASLEESLAAKARSSSELVVRERIAEFERRLSENASGRGKVMEQLRAEVIQKVRNRLEAQFTSEAPHGAELLTRQFGRLSERISWARTKVAQRRIFQALTRLLTCRERKWLTEPAVLAMAAAALHEASAQHELLENLAAVPRLAADVFELPAERLKREDDPLPPWSPCYQGTQSPGVDAWMASPARGVGWLPASLLRRRMETDFRRQLPGILDAHQRDVLEWATQCVEREFSAWRKAVGAVAAETYARFVAVANGKTKAAPVLVDASHFRQRLTELLSKISGLANIRSEGQPADRAEPRLAASSEPRSSPEIGPSVVIDLRRDLGTRGCPVCDHLANVTGQILSRWQYDLYASEEAQRNYAEKGDLCALHLWQLEAKSSPVGISVGHVMRVERMARALEHAATTRGPSSDLTALAPRTDNCRVCSQLRAAEAHYLGHLASLLNTPEGREVYRKAQGPCLRHIVQLASLCREEEVRAFLFSEAARRFAEMAEDMQSYGLKSEALRRERSNTDEEDAWWRALTHLAGARRVSCALTCDGEI